MSWGGELTVICSVCGAKNELEVELEGDARDPCWIAYPEACEDCNTEFSKETKEDIETQAIEAALEPSFEYDTWDEWALEHAMSGEERKRA